MLDDDFEDQDSVAVSDAPSLSEGLVNAVAQGETRTGDTPADDTPESSEAVEVVELKSPAAVAEEVVVQFEEASERLGADNEKKKMT